MKNSWWVLGVPAPEAAGGWWSPADLLENVILQEPPHPPAGFHEAHSFFWNVSSSNRWV